MGATRTKGSTVGSVQCVDAHRVGYATAVMRMGGEADEGHQDQGKHSGICAVCECAYGRVCSMQLRL